MGRAMVVGETIEDVILVMVCSCLEKMAQGTGMGLIISDCDSRAFYPLFISFDRVTDIHYNRHWHLDFSKAFDNNSHDILMNNKKKVSWLMAKSRQIYNWLKTVLTSIDVQIVIYWNNQLKE